MPEETGIRITWDAEKQRYRAYCEEVPEKVVHADSAAAAYNILREVLKDYHKRGQKDV